MNRRQFIHKSTILGTIPFIQTSCFNDSKVSEYKLGYQLFSIRDQMKDNPIATLKVLKDAGYEDFEIYGYNATEDLIYGFTPIKFKSILDHLQLSVTSGHYGFSEFLYKPNSELLNFVDKCISAAQKLNSKYITWPWLYPEQRNLKSFRILVKKLNLIGKHITENSNLSFAYHNHGFEFESHNGINGYSLILNETDPDLVKLQMDMYWVFHSSNYTPKELVRLYPGRFTMWHIKDMDKTTRDYTELGNGSINYIDALPDPKESGLDYFYIEQGGNFSIDSTTSARQNANYFNSYLKKLI